LLAYFVGCHKISLGIAFSFPDARKLINQYCLTIQSIVTKHVTSWLHCNWQSQLESLATKKTHFTAMIMRKSKCAFIPLDCYLLCSMHTIWCPECYH